jgi:cytochrome bd-type quinol oxidase subunit 2
MFKNTRKILAGLMGATVLVLVPLAVPALASADADIAGNLCEGASLNIGEGASCADTSDGTQKINDIIHAVINVFSLIVGVTSVLMIIVGGFRYITSGGESSNVSGAKNTIIYAIIGLVVVALAQFIVQFVLNKVTTTGN